jgi:hypothetical protein
MLQIAEFVMREFKTRASPRVLRLRAMAGQARL